MKVIYESIIDRIANIQRQTEIDDVKIKEIQLNDSEWASFKQEVNSTICSEVAWKVNAISLETILFDGVLVRRIKNGG